MIDKAALLNRLKDIQCPSLSDEETWEGTSIDGRRVQLALKLIDDIEQNNLDVPCGSLCMYCHNDPHTLKQDNFCTPLRGREQCGWCKNDGCHKGSPPPYICDEFF